MLGHETLLSNARGPLVSLFNVTLLTHQTAADHAIARASFRSKFGHYAYAADEAIEPADSGAVSGHQTVDEDSPSEADPNRLRKVSLGHDTKRRHAVGMSGPQLTIREKSKSR